MTRSYVTTFEHAPVWSFPAFCLAGRGFCMHGFLFVRRRNGRTARVRVTVRKPHVAHVLNGGEPHGGGHGPATRARAGRCDRGQGRCFRATGFGGRGSHRIRPTDGVATSTTHVHLLARFRGIWVGGNSIQYLRDTTALSLVTRGDALNLSGEPLMDAELLIAAAPGWVSTMPHADVPEQWGQATVEVMEHLEPHPLGRAEWMRAFGWMTNRSLGADSAFEALSLRYHDARVSPAQPFRMFTGSIRWGGMHEHGSSWPVDRRC